MFKNAIEYPLRGNRISRTVVGGLFTTASIILFPLFTLIGYSIQIIESSMKGDTTPPEFTDFVHTTKRGAVGFGIITAYIMTPLLLAGVVFAIIWGVRVTFNLSAPIFSISMFVGLSIVTPIMTISFYLAPVALTNYALDNDIRSAFDFSRIIGIAGTKTYLIASIYPIIILFCVGTITLILSSSIVGVLATPFIQFYAQVSVTKIFAEAYETATDEPTPTLNKILELLHIPQKHRPKSVF